MSRIIVAIYRHFLHSREAVCQLLAENISPDNICLVTPEDSPTNTDIALESLWPSELLPVVGIGHITALGPILTSLRMTMLRGNQVSLLQTLLKWDIPNPDADVYAECVRCGATLLGIWVSYSQTKRVQEIMGYYQPIDIEMQTDHWREQGWRAFNETNPTRPLFTLIDDISHADHNLLEVASRVRKYDRAMHV